MPLVLLLTPFILRTWRSFTPFFVTLTVETLVAGVFFLVLPTAQAYPERVASGLFAGLFRFADRMNLEYNEFPSLHVAFAVTAAVVFGRRCGWLGRSLFFLWGAGVAASTLFLHEHHLLDLLGGAALGLAAVATVQRQASREPVLEALRIEGLSFKEFTHFARRHPRYLLVAFALVRTSLGRWQETRLLRAAYALAQSVDDVLDGDRKVKEEPEAFVQAVLRVLRGLAPAGFSPAEQLAGYVAATAGDAERREMIDLFEVLLEDRRRMDARRVWSAAEARRAPPQDLRLLVRPDLRLLRGRFARGRRARADRGPHLGLPRPRPGEGLPEGALQHPRRGVGAGRVDGGADGPLAAPRQARRPGVAAKRASPGRRRHRGPGRAAGLDPGFPGTADRCHVLQGVGGV